MEHDYNETTFFRELFWISNLRQACLRIVFFLLKLMRKIVYLIYDLLSGLASCLWQK